jgi:hypothetical protein
MFRSQTFKLKTTLITVFDKQRVIHKEYALEGQRVNSAFCVEVVGRLLQRIPGVTPQLVPVALQCPFAFRTGQTRCCRDKPRHAMPFS